MSKASREKKKKAARAKARAENNIQPEQQIQTRIDKQE